MNNPQAADTGVSVEMTDAEKAWRQHLNKANRENWNAVTFDPRHMNKIVGELDRLRAALLAGAAGGGEPTDGDWIRADDFHRNVKELDEALNGPGGAIRPSLIDVLSQVSALSRKLGRPVLSGMCSAEPAAYRARRSEQEKWYLHDAPVGWWECQPLYTAPPPPVGAPQEGVSVPPGWKLVPTQLTVLMGIAAYAAYDNSGEDAAFGPQEAVAIYDAMLDAAPQPPASAPPLAVGVEPEGLPFGIIDPDYARIFTKARILAWSYGFACVPHGSFTRDLDLVLVPWEPNATDEAGARVVAMLAQACDLKLRDDDPFQKPHGRRNWTLMLPGFGEPRWVDLSVLPCVVKEGAPK